MNSISKNTVFHTRLFIDKYVKHSSLTEKMTMEKKSDGTQVKKFNKVSTIHSGKHIFRTMPFVTIPGLTDYIIKRLAGKVFSSAIENHNLKVTKIDTPALDIFKTIEYKLNEIVIKEIDQEIYLTFGSRINSTFMNKMNEAQALNNVGVELLEEFKNEKIIDRVKINLSKIDNVEQLTNIYNIMRESLLDYICVYSEFLSTLPIRRKRFIIESINNPFGQIIDILRIMKQSLGITETVGAIGYLMMTRSNHTIESVLIANFMDSFDAMIEDLPTKVAVKKIVINKEKNISIKIVETKTYLGLYEIRLPVLASGDFLKILKPKRPIQTDNHQKRERSNNRRKNERSRQRKQ